MNAVVWTLVNGPGIFIQRSTFNAPPAQVARHQFHELARPVAHEVTNALPFFFHFSPQPFFV